MHIASKQIRTCPWLRTPSQIKAVPRKGPLALGKEIGAARECEEQQSKWEDRKTTTGKKSFWKGRKYRYRHRRVNNDVALGVRRETMGSEQIRKEELKSIYGRKQKVVMKTKKRTMEKVRKTHSICKLYLLERYGLSHNKYLTVFVEWFYLPVKGVYAGKEKTA